MRELLLLVCLVGCGSSIPGPSPVSDAGPEAALPYDASSPSFDVRDAAPPAPDRALEVALPEVSFVDAEGVDRPAADGSLDVPEGGRADHVVPALDAVGVPTPDVAGREADVREVGLADAGVADTGPCGHRGEPCCWGNGALCLDDLTCRGAMVTICACGDPGETCCPGLVCNVVPGRTNTCRAVGSRRLCG